MSTLNEDANARRKKITGKAMIIFIAVMIGLTFFSNTINNLMLPKVLYEAPASGALIKEVTGNGNVEAKAFRDLYIDTAMKVTDVMVSAGDAVIKGQTLLTLDTEDLQSGLQDETDKLDQKKLALEKLVTAGERLQITADKLRLTNEELKEAGSPESILNLQKALQTAAQNLETAQRDADSSKSLYEAGSAAANDVTGTAMRLETAKLEYDIALRNIEQAKKDNTRALENNQNEIESNLKEMENNQRDIESTKLDITMAERRITELREEMELGTVAAPCDGIIAEMYYSEGMMANASQPLYKIAETESGFEFMAVVDTSAAAYLEPGDKAEITISALDNRSIQGTVSQIKDNQQQIGVKKDVHIDIPSDGLIGGESGTAYVKKNIGSYDTLVSNSAIGQDNDGFFVYVLKEKNGPLGNEFYVEKVTVNIGDSDSLKTAVLSGLSLPDKVVSSSGKPLSDGSRVMPET